MSKEAVGIFENLYLLFLTSLCLLTGSVDNGFLNTLKETPGTYPLLFLSDFLEYLSANWPLTKPLPEQQLPIVSLATVTGHSRPVKELRFWHDEVVPFSLFLAFPKPETQTQEV